MMHRRSKDLGKVFLSVNLFGDCICVDIFQRLDQTYGFEEYRRDVETGEGWFPIGFYSGQRFESFAQAKVCALQTVACLEEAL